MLEGEGVGIGRRDTKAATGIFHRCEQTTFEKRGGAFRVAEGVWFGCPSLYGRWGRAGLFDCAGGDQHHSILGRCDEPGQFRLDVVRPRL